MRDQLVEAVAVLAVRFSHLGIRPDLAGMSIGDLWGLWRYLQRIAWGE
jgi:hypothetical protein